jgi:hypothetical protein
LIVKKRNVIIAVALTLALVTGCKNAGKEAEKTEPATPVVQADAGISGKVMETMDASGYTYVLVDTGEEQIWVAGPQTAVKVGDEVYIPGGSPMPNFESKTLNRTFEQIIFASSIMVGGADQTMPTDPAPVAKPQATPNAQVDLSGIVKPEGGKTVTEIFAGRQELNGKNVLLRGKVVKYMTGIMGKNWLHVKDGTGTPGSDDLVVTTQIEAKVGDTVLVNGTLVTDKDFGSGYRYDVIVEDAEVTVE